MKTLLIVTMASVATVAWLTAERPFASQPPGARGYLNPTTVSLPSQSGICSDVRRSTSPNNAFLEDYLLNSVGIRAHIQSGGVTLSGRRDNPEEAALAMWQAYARMQSVVNQIYPLLN
jgi:hypothetical protein